MERIARMFGVKRYNDMGFTLIELLVVIAIIGILAGISIPMFLGQRTKAIRSEATTNLSVLLTLQEQYYAEYGRYAPWPDKNDPNSITGGVRYRGTYGTNDNGIEEIFPAFKPGALNDLYFRYIIQSLASGQQWHAVAIPISGKGADGMRNIWLNYNNEWEQL